MRQQHVGFTLIELLIALVIAAVLATIALPSFSELFVSNRVTTQTNDLINALNYARSEAIRRGIPVCIRSTSGTDNDWSQGWQIFVDPNANRTSSSTICSTTGATILQSHEAISGGSTLASTTNFAQFVRFNAFGVAANSSDVGVSGSFSLCRSDSNSAKSKLISISTTGLTALSQTAPSC